MIKRNLWIWLILCTLMKVKAQSFTYVHTRYADAFTHWELYTDQNPQRPTGSLELTWQFDTNWTEWNFRIGDTSGVIRTKWPDDPNLWELRSLNEVVTIRTVWPNDPRIWRIMHDGRTYTLRSKWANAPTEWNLQDHPDGAFDIVMYDELDPRDWEIYDEMDLSVSLPVKIALLFIAIYHATPKW